ncbi:Polyketide cyclase SnoaL-like protein [Aduncisulcus paluster]|uniref:Polyketide cyclase SnoaL-like protein n=1 Tax=Aduncisulcus paluster TaxID=2918883 RepID=A0ABQ5JXH3_9EUKA|nr:Polyketide cyclase SnoaL-like protein [Aduncisulcus paluster]
MSQHSSKKEQKVFGIDVPHEIQNENLESLELALELIIGGRVHDAVENHYRKDVILHHSSTMKTSRGHAGIYKAANKLTSAFSHIKLNTIWSKHACADYATIWCCLEMTHSSPINLGHGTAVINPKTPHQVVQLPYTVVARFCNETPGMIAEVWAMADYMGLVRQLGVDPETSIIGTRLAAAQRTHRDFLEPDEHQKRFSLHMQGVPPSVVCAQKFLRACSDSDFAAAVSLWDQEDAVIIQDADSKRTCEKIEPEHFDDTVNALRRLFRVSYGCEQDVTLTPHAVMFGPLRAAAEQGWQAGRCEYVCIIGEKRALQTNKDYTMFKEDDEGTKDFDRGVHHLKCCHHVGTAIQPSYIHTRTMFAMYLLVNKERNAICGMWHMDDHPTHYAQMMVPPCHSIISTRRTGTAATRATLRLIDAFERCETARSELRHIVSTLKYRNHTEPEAAKRLAEKYESDTGMKLGQAARITSAFEFWHKAFSTIRVHVKRTVASDDLCMARLWITARHSGPIGSAKEPTYRRVGISAALSVKIDAEDDRITDSWLFVDIPSIFAQIRAQPPLAKRIYMPPEKVRSEESYFEQRDERSAQENANLRTFEKLMSHYSQPLDPTSAAVDQLTKGLEDVFSYDSCLGHNPSTAYTAVISSEGGMLNGAPSGCASFAPAMQTQADEKMRHPHSHIEKGKHLCARALAVSRAPWTKLEAIPQVVVSSGPYIAAWWTWLGETRKKGELTERSSEEEEDIAKEREKERLFHEYHGHVLEEGKKFAASMCTFYSFSPDHGQAYEGVHLLDRWNKCIQLNIEDPFLCRRGSVYEMNKTEHVVLQKGEGEMERMEGETTDVAAGLGE